MWLWGAGEEMIPVPNSATFPLAAMLDLGGSGD